MWFSLRRENAHPHRGEGEDDGLSSPMKSPSSDQASPRSSRDHANPPRGSHGSPISRSPTSGRHNSRRGSPRTNRRDSRYDSPFRDYGGRRQGSPRGHRRDRYDHSRDRYDRSRDRYDRSRDRYDYYRNRYRYSPRRYRNDRYDSPPRYYRGNHSPCRGHDDWHRSNSNRSHSPDHGPRRSSSPRRTQDHNRRDARQSNEDVAVDLSSRVLQSLFAINRAPETQAPKSQEHDFESHNPPPVRRSLSSSTGEGDRPDWFRCQSP
nr:uncharacterized protein LOC129255083 [Lytechinus pictus]